MKTLILMSCAVLAFVSVADVETIDELVLDEAKTIDVAAGNTKRIEYLSGTTAVTLTKTGEGTLELAVIGNTNATILVTAGTLKSVRPAKVTMNGNVYFHLDANDASSFEMETVNGTNFVTRVNDAAGGQLYATPLGSRPKPFYGDVTLNGLPVLDFGPYSRAVSGQGSALTVSTPAIINELFYVWQDHEGTKDNVPADTLGPNAVNMRYSYRGKGGAGDDFKMYYSAHGSISATTTVDGSKVGKDTPVGEGWHTAAWYAKTPITSPISDYGFYGFGNCANGSAGYGGVRIAEAIACTDALTDVERTHVTCYLKRKWFGGDAVQKIILRAGATLDTSLASFPVKMLDAQENSIILGNGLSFTTVLADLPNQEVSGTYAVTDRDVSLTPNLAFADVAEVSVATGTGLVNRISSGSGALRKSGAGVLKVAFLNAGISSLSIDSGTFVVDPLVTPAVHIHVDATRLDTMTFNEVNGTNLVTQWRDVNGNGRYCSQSTERHAYGSKDIKNYPFLQTAFTNGLPVVDFGTFNDFMHQDGWGAEMDVTPKMSDAISIDNPPLWNMIAVWGDREEAKDIPLVDGQQFRGPTLLGNGDAFYRGYGGGGEAFYMRKRGSSNMGEDNWIDGSFVDYVTWMDTYRPPERLFVQNTRIPDSLVRIQQVGGNATLTTPDYTRGVCGGLRLGEMLLFRHQLLSDDRIRIDRALGAKWFNRANPCVYGTVAISTGASASFPYADVTVTNLMVAGTVTAKSLTAKNLTVANGTIAAPLTMTDGGQLSVTPVAGSYPCLTAQSASFSGEGTIVLNAPGSGYPAKIIATEDGPETPQYLPWRTTQGMDKIILVRRSDGYYLDSVAGMVIMLK